MKSGKKNYLEIPHGMWQQKPDSIGHLSNMQERAL